MGESRPPPTVAAVFPNGGETFTDTLPIFWSASDPDGDELRYTVLYSGDGGGSWQALATGVETTTLTVDSSLLPGSASQSLVKTTPRTVRTSPPASRTAALPFPTGHPGPRSISLRMAGVCLRQLPHLARRCVRSGRWVPAGEYRELDPLRARFPGHRGQYRSGRSVRRHVHSDPIRQRQQRPSRGKEYHLQDRRGGSGISADRVEAVTVGKGERSTNLCRFLTFVSASAQGGHGGTSVTCPASVQPGCRAGGGPARTT